MARREDVETSIWEDEDFDRLSDDAALLYLWSFTNERCPMAGIYKVKERHILEGRMTPARRTAALGELADTNFLFYSNGWLWVRSRVKHLRSRGPNIVKSINGTLHKVPTDHPLLAAFVREYEKGSWFSSSLCDLDLEDPSKTLGDPSEGCQGKGQGKGLGKEVQKADVQDPDQLPEDFPPNLIAAVEGTLPILRRVAATKKAKPVTRLALARTIQSLPNYDHIMVAGELEHWALHGRGENKARKDIVATYRSFLKNADAIAPAASSPAVDYDANAKEYAV